MVAARSTEQIVADFHATDLLLENRATLSPDDDAAICVTRGWMIDELERRDEVHRIGL
jgi:hypothetical protein